MVWETHVLMYPAFFTLVVWAICSQEVINGFTGSHNKLCNLGISRTQSSFIYKGVKYMVYMSLCKPLRDLPRKYISGLKNPENVKLIILKKSKMSNDVLASASGEFIFDNDKVKLGLDSPCEEFSNLNRLNYSVVMYFECSQEENEPIFEDFRRESCSFIFKWQAPFACLLLHQNTSENCLLKFEKNIFDMTSLTHPSHYVLTQGDYKVYINFCRPVNLQDCQSSGSVISGCIIHKTETYPMENNECEFIKEKSKIEVKFSMIQDVKATMSFECKHDVFAIKPEMRVSKKGRKLSIIIGTSAVCLNDDRCDINYDDERYSLPRGSNAMVKGINEIFLLSACGLLMSDSFWLGGEASASLINETVMNLGWKRSLVRDAKGELTLTLTEGSFCPGTRQRAKTVIKFICSEEDTDLKFLDRSEKCVFSFEWKGPAYCPVLEATGKGCVVRDPDYATNYYLGDDGDGPNSENEFEIRHNDTIFRLNLCGKVKKSCHSDTNVSACLLTNNKEIILGRGSSLTYSFKQGSLVLELWGSECAPNVTSHVVVNVICEFGASGRIVPVSNDSSCVFNFVWYTSKICPKEEKRISCTVTNQNGSVVDLNPLRLPSSNYRVPKDNESYFLLNVCGPLWYGSYETCPPSSAACLVSKGKHFLSIGQIYSDLTVTHDNEVVLVYKNVYFLPSWKTVITFVCDERNEGPEYVETKQLKNSFKWKTELACFDKADSGRVKELKEMKVMRKQIAVEERTEKMSVTVSNVSVSKGVSHIDDEGIRPSSKSEDEEEEVSCIISDSQSPIDLSVLEPVYLSFSKCLRLYVDVCRKVYCQSSNSSETFRLGSRINRPIVNDRGFVTVNYYDDVLCGDHSNRSLSFVFVCDRSQGKGIPRLANHSSCIYTFLWNTRVVCPNDVLVFDKSNHVVNKSSNEVVSLDRSLMNPIQIERESESFYVNLLSSEVVDDEVPCSGNICEKKDGSWISHGILKNLITYEYNYNRIVMEFEGGDLCNLTRRYSSKVYLNCWENGFSQPKSADWAVSRDYCELILELATPCFEYEPVNKAQSVWIICLAVLLVVGSVSFASYYVRRRRKRRASSSELVLIRRERQKYCDKEL